MTAMTTSHWVVPKVVSPLSGERWCRLFAALVAYLVLQERLERGSVARPAPAGPRAAHDRVAVLVRPDDEVVRSPIPAR